MRGVYICFTPLIGGADRAIVDLRRRLDLRQLGFNPLIGGADRAMKLEEALAAAREVEVSIPS